MSKNSVDVRKEKEIEMAWSQHREIGKTVSKEQSFEINERNRTRKRWY